MQGASKQMQHDRRASRSRRTRCEAILVLRSGEEAERAEPCSESAWRLVRPSEKKFNALPMGVEALHKLCRLLLDAGYNVFLREAPTSRSSVRGHTRVLHWLSYMRGARVQDVSLAKVDSVFPGGSSILACVSCCLLGPPLDLAACKTEPSFTSIHVITPSQLAEAFAILSRPRMTGATDSERIGSDERHVGARRVLLFPEGEHTAH